MTQKRLDAFFKSTSAPKATVSGGQEPNKKAKITNVDPRDPRATQSMRAQANKNMALAKQAVIACEKQGQLPFLKDLLIESSWKDVLSAEFDKPYFKDLERFVREQVRPMARASLAALSPYHAPRPGELLSPS
jgi:hypothetical protein